MHSQKILQALQKVMVLLYYYYNPQNPGELEVGEGL